MGGGSSRALSSSMGLRGGFVRAQGCARRGRRWVVFEPAGRGPQALWSRPFGWLWTKRAWVAASIGIVFTASTLYVLWAIRDLPDPTQDVLAAGDVVVLDRNRQPIEA